MTAISVALGVMLVAATQTLTSSLSSGFGTLFGEIYGGADIVVEADPDAADDAASGSETNFAAPEPIFTADDVATVAAVEGVQLAAGGLQVPASGLLEKDQDRADPSALLGGPPTQIFSWYGDPEIDRATLVDGEAPTDDDEIVLDIDAIENLGYELGDMIAVSTSTATEEFEIVGTVRFGDENNLQGATLAYVSLESAQRLTDTDMFQTIGVVGEPGVDLDALADDIGALLPADTRAITGEAKAAEEGATLNDALVYVDIVTIVFAIIALFVGSYIILNTFRIVVTQRTREFGLLRAIGMSGRQVLRMILLEAILVAVVASTLGILLGWGLAWIVTSIITMLGTDVFGPLVVPWQAVVWSYALGVTVTALSALAPALTAARVSPMEALREAGTQARKPLTVRNVAGGLVVALGLVGVVLGLTTGWEQPYLLVGIGGGLVVLGVTLLAAQVLVPLAYALRGLLTRLFGVDGKLAANNIRQEPRRSANTAAALMIGVMLLALVATFAESLKTVIDEELGSTNADVFVFSTQDTVPEDAIAAVEDLPEVALVSEVGSGMLEYDGDEYAYSVVDPEAAVRVGGFTSEPDLRELADGVFIGPEISDLGVEVGDDVTVTTDTATVTLAVTGEYLTGGDAGFYVDWETSTLLADDLEPVQLAIVFTDDIDTDEARDAVIDDMGNDVLADYPSLVAFPPEVFASLISSVIDLILGIITALLSAALVIAVLGVANTLLLSVTERTREIGLLRAVGLRRREVWRMVTLESVIMAVFGAIAGMVLGVGLGAALVVTLQDLGFSTPAVPWAWLVLYTALAMAAGIIAAIWPAWRASRMDILQAVAADG
nr:ABC transporter permease [Microbacterium thalassium]